MTIETNFFEFYHDEETNAVVVKVTLASVKNMPNEATIKQELKLTAYRDAELDVDGIASLIADIKTASVDKSDIKEIKGKVAKVRPHELTVSFGDNNMLATIKIVVGQGAPLLNDDKLIKFILASGLKKGILKNSISALVSKSRQMKPGEIVEEVVAKGKLPIKGKDAYIEYLVPDFSQRVLRPKELSDGRVDMRELGEICQVTKGRPIAQKISAEEGVDGFDVLGNILTAEAGADITLIIGEGAIADQQDENLIRSDIEGMPKHTENGVMVSHVFSIENVDVGTGNINFEGSIIVNGNVCECMKVIATDDVIVGGLVESAFIATQGNIIIGQGVIGHQLDEDVYEDQFSATLDAGGSISAAYVQYAELKAKGDISVTQYLSHSQVTCHGDLWVGVKEREKANGKLFGCYVQAGKRVSAGILGSPSSTATIIDYNHLLDKLKEKLLLIEDKTSKYIDKANKVHTLIAQIKNNEVEKKDLLMRLVDALKQFLPLLGKLNQRYYDTNDEIVELLAGVNVTAFDKIHYGIEIIAANEYMSFKREHGPSQIAVHDKKLQLTPLVHATEKAN